ncbi:MAG: fdxN element excision recombinase XisF [Calothrix sp. MO_192.B10]|nr:fdxN element excision recombinase XisF [Calothrix sp. MO_192.B10]
MRIGYVRVSTGEQAETDALEQQTARVEKAGAALIFADVESGRSDKRSQFNQMLAMCKQGGVSELVITRIDRLARSVITIHRTMVTLEEYGVKLIVLDAPVDTSSPFGWFSVNQMAGLAEFESRLLQNRIKHGMAYFREQKKASPRPPFGYYRVDEKYAPDMRLDESGNSKWAIANEIIDYFLLDLSTLRSTARYVLEKYNISWTAAGLRYWMTSPVLQGHTAYNIHGNINKPEKWEIYKDTHPPLISPAKAKQIYQKLADNKSKFCYGNVKKNNEILPLTGQIICGCCGYKCFFVQRRANHRVRVRCKKRENLGKSFCNHKISSYLDEILTAIDTALISRYETVQNYTVTNLVIKEKDDPEIIARREQLQALRQMPQNPIIQSAIEQTLLEIQTIEQKEVVSKQINDELQEMFTICFSDREYWNSLSFPEKRIAYREFVDYVKVLNGEILEIKLLV